jgi:hypothetical protein
LTVLAAENQGDFNDDVRAVGDVTMASMAS